MSDQHSFVSPDHYHPDPYTTSQTAERILNAAILNAEISRSFEEYLEIFDEFYADDIEGSNETMKEPIRGRSECAHFFSASWLPFMQWPKSVVCRYPFEKRRFLEMLTTRPILRGHWSWSGLPAKSAL